MAVDTTRPPPEHFLSLIRQQQRGRLRIFLGFAAGVGKTYEMLQEAHRLKKQGVDVVVGVVETHGRAETAALLEGLEQVPRRRIEYRGVVLQEMDLDAILARKPTVVLVDELAHTNAPGSKHAKRYEDVEDILRAGIHVISTLNIQHLESLYDMVEKATGVKVKERLPDYILGLADQLVNVDLPAEDLRERLAAGKIYPAERIERAMANFFTEENLTRLRELALGELAFRLDRRRREQTNLETWTSTDKVMVCLSSRGPRSDALLRKAARLAERLGAPWYAVYVQTPGEAPDRIAAETQRTLSNTQQLAQQLGGVIMTLKAADVPHTLASFAREYGITYALFGRSQQPWYRRLWPGPLHDQFLRAVRNVDVIIVDPG